MFSKKYFYQLRTSFIQIAVQILIPLLLTPYMIGKLQEDMYGLWVLFITILGYFGLTGLLKEMLKPSLHYFIITVSALIVLSSDNIIISSFIGIGSVAFYAIGYKLVDVSQKIFFKIVDVMIPDIARLDKERNYNAILKLHNKMLFLSIFLGLVGYGILFFYGIDFLQWWVGKKYVLDENIFRIFIAFGMVHAGVHVSAILNVVLSIILLRYYGLLGVAMGTLLAHLLTSGWFTTWWFYKQIHMKVKEDEGS